MVKTLATLALTATLSMQPTVNSGSSTGSDDLSGLNVLTLVMPDRVVPRAKAPTTSSLVRVALKEMFRLESGLDTRIRPELLSALLDYRGPKTSIGSLRRNWASNPKSKHNCGKAVDFGFDRELIDWLVLTDEGKTWLAKHNLMFYIEDRPGSKALLPFKQDERYAQFVFENGHATGDHVHVAVK